MANNNGWSDERRAKQSLLMQKRWKDKARYDGIRSEFQTAYDTAQSHWYPYLLEAQRDSKFMAGDHYTAEEKQYLEKQGRAELKFRANYKIMRMLTGYQRKNRLAYKVDPTEGSDEMTANQFTALLLHIAQAGNLYHTMSDAFRSTLNTGMALVHMWIDYGDDLENGSIKFKWVPYNRYLLDPNFSMSDFSDCNYILRREYITESNAKMLFPDRKKDIESLKRADAADEKYKLYIPHKGMDGKEMLSYDEFCVRTTREQEFMVDPQGRVPMMAFDGDSDQKKMILSQVPDIKFVKKTIPTVELRILLNGEVMYVGDELTGIDDFAYTPLVCFFTPEIAETDLRLQSLTRLIRDPQIEKNKRISKMLDLTDKQIHNGLVAEQTAVINPDSLYNRAHSPVIWVVENSVEKVKPLPTSDIPQGLFQLNTVFDDLIMDIAGINNEMLGMPTENDVSGMLGKLRQSAGLTTQQDIFDGYRLSKKLIGNKIIKAIQANWGPEKVKRIINQDPTEEFYKEDFGKYDAILEEGVLTDSQRQMAFAQALALLQQGAPIPWSYIISISNLEGKEELMKFLKQGEEAQQAQAEKEKVWDDLQKALIMSATEKNKAMAEQEESQKIEDIENAKLDRIKGVVQIMEGLAKTKKDLSTSANLAKRLTEDVGTGKQGTVTRPIQNPTQPTKLIR